MASNTTDPRTTPRLTSSQTGTFYFAYGSNLSAVQMSIRLPNDPASSIPVALARLDGYKWIICERGYANVVRVSLGTSGRAGEVKEGTESKSTGGASGGGEMVNGVASNSQTSHDDETAQDINSSDIGNDAEESVVWGIIYNMSSQDEAQLDLYEGHNEHRNPDPVPNPNVKERIEKPFLQGGWDYNKLYLPVRVAKWFAEPCDYGFSRIDSEDESDLTINDTAVQTTNPPQSNTISTATSTTTRPNQPTASPGPQNKADLNTIRALVYVDEYRISPGKISHEYIGRMNRGITEAVSLGLPESWVDRVMRRWVVKDVLVDDEGYVGEDVGYVENDREGGGWDETEDGGDEGEGEAEQTAKEERTGKGKEWNSGA